MIAKYLENTHATTHNQYHMELLDVFALEHEKKAFTDVGNRYVFHSFRFNCYFASGRFCLPLGIVRGTFQTDSAAQK